MFVVSSTLFNHEHERRGSTFITQKIANYVGKYYHNNDTKPLQLGNLNSLRDWSYAEDCIEAIYLMMQQETPDNYVIASGQCYSVRTFAELAFKEIGIDLEWSGSGLDEVGIDNKTGKIIIEINPRFFRDLELHALIGDSSKARQRLGWSPKTSIEQIVNKMVKAAINRQQK